MGLTSILKLPYPELNDPANVPVDMKQLADAIELVIGGVLPQPVARSMLTSQTITSTSTDYPYLPQAAIRNPHTSLFLLVNVTITTWCDTDPNGTFYGSLRTSGQTGVFDDGGIRLMNTYASTSVIGIVTIAPGATMTAQLEGHKGSTAAVSLASVRNLITPIGWLKTGTIS